LLFVFGGVRIRAWRATKQQGKRNDLGSNPTEVNQAMWLSCHGQQAIADAVGISQPQVNEFLQKISETEMLPKPIKSA